MFAVLQWVFSFLALGESLDRCPKPPLTLLELGFRVTTRGGGGAGSPGSLKECGGIRWDRRGGKEETWDLNAWVLNPPSPFCSSGVPGRAAPCTTGPGLDPGGPLPGLALQRQGHPTGRGSPICPGPQLGHLETFPGLLPHLGEGPQEPGAGLGSGIQNRASEGHSQKSNLVVGVGRAPSAPQLVKTAELDPSHNYLFGFHPHGVLVIGAFSNFCTEATGFSRTFPGLCPHLLMLPCWFHLPLFRDYIMCSGEEQGARAREP